VRQPRWVQSPYGEDNQTRDCCVGVSKQTGRIYEDRSIHNLSVKEVDGKATTGGRLGEIDAQADGAHGSHGHNIQSRSLYPLPKGRTGVPRTACGMVSAVGSALIATATKEARLFMSVGCSGCVGVCGRGFAVEEAHRG
jgi:hypothetical protein